MDPSVLVAGETLVDFLPDSPGPLADVERFDRRAGGAPANVAVRLSQLDRPPWFWTRVGADPFGDFLVDQLTAHGVPQRFVERDTEAGTTLAFVSHDQDAESSFTFYRDETADTRMRPGGVPDETLEDVDWVSVGGVLLASDPSREAIVDLVERANERGCTVCFDPNARPELWESDAFETQTRLLLERCDVVKATPADLRAAGFAAPDPADPIDPDDPTGPTELAEAVAAAGPHTVFVTMGAKGSFALATDDAPWGPATETHDGFDVAVVDATGAGDAFTAGALAAFDRHGADELTSIDLGRVLAFANAVAAASTTSSGGTSPLGDVDRILSAPDE